MGSIDYTLMHKNLNVANFSINDESWTISNYDTLDSIFNPVNTLIGKNEQAQQFLRWLDNRCIPNSREGVERLRAAYQINDLKELMMAKYGLSLSDHFWVKKSGDNVQWECVNFFDNNYSGNLGKIFFDKYFQKQIGDENNPDSSLNGSLRKKWEKREDGSYLLKGGTKLGQEPYNEVYASMLLEHLDIKHAEYRLENLGNEAVSACKCLIDKDTEIISAADICRTYGIKHTYEGYVKLCQKKGLTGIEKKLGEMIVTDYLIDNVDRHWNNFGIIRDANNGEWMEPIPLFDNGNSVWVNQTPDAKSPSNSSSFGSNNDECVKMVNIGDYIKKEKLRNMEEIFSEAFKSYRDDDRKTQLHNAIREKIAVVSKLIDT